MLATENLWRAWSFQPLVIGGGLVAIGFFLHGWLRLHRRKASLAPWTRIPLFVAGVVVTVLAIVSPIDAIGEGYLQSVHMLQHVLIADLGIALTVVAVRGPLTVFLLPRDLLVPLARVGWLRRLLRFLLRPGVSYVVWVVVLVAWHVPAFYEAALHHTAWHDLMHLSFVVGGLLVWTQIVDPSRHHRLTLNERVGYTALVFCTGQILAYVILFDFRPLFSTLRRPARAAARPLAAHRPEARRRRDDGRADRDPRPRVRAAAARRPARAAGQARGSGNAPARRLMRSASSFTFEPLFVVLGIAALVAYARAWRRERRGRLARGRVRRRRRS